MTKVRRALVFLGLFSLVVGPLSVASGMSPLPPKCGYSDWCKNGLIE